MNVYPDFIRLEKKGGNAFFLNTSHIVYFHECVDGKGTYVEIDNLEEGIEVVEDTDMIFSYLIHQKDEV